MAARTVTRIVPHFWYTKEAKEAARFYVKTFPKSRIDRVWSINSGSTECVEFRLFGQPFFAMSSGEHDPFNDAISLRVSCKTQKEVDRYWNAILKNGGKAVACGWIRDKYGRSRGSDVPAGTSTERSCEWNAAAVLCEPRLEAEQLGVQ